MITSYSERNEEFTGFYSVVILYCYIFYSYVITDHVSISLSKPNSLTSEKINKSIYLAL